MEDNQFLGQELPPEKSAYQKVLQITLLVIVAIAVFFVLKALLMYFSILKEPEPTVPPDTVAPIPLTEEAVAQARLDLPVSLPTSGTSSVSIIDASADSTEYEPATSEQSNQTENQTTPSNQAESEPMDEPEINDPAITVNNVSVTSDAESHALTIESATVIDVDADNGVLMASDGQTTWRVVFSDSTTFTINTSVIEASSIKSRDNISITGSQLSGSDEIVAESISIIGVQERAIPVY